MMSEATSIKSDVRRSSWDGCYPVGQASRLTGVPRATLYAWKKQGIISPDAEAYSLFDFDEKPSRVGYSLTDLAIIKLLRGLRNKRLDRKTLAQALRQLLREHGGVNNPAWQQAQLYLSGKEVYAHKPDGWDGESEAKVAGAGRRGKRRVATPLDLFEEEALYLVPESFRAYVQVDPEIMGGDPMLRRYYIPTSLLAAMYRQGTSYAEIARLYAPIPQKTLEKAIEYELNLDRVAAQTGAVGTGQ